MSDRPPEPLTVKDLLPAIIELASIQADLLSTLENPSPARSFSPLPPPLVMSRGLDDLEPYTPPPAPIGVNTAYLVRRSRVLLAWLLSAVKAGGQ